MSPSHEKVFWNSMHIGTIDDFRIDHFECYGLWKRVIHDDIYGLFLAQVESEGGAIVTMGSSVSQLTGTVDNVPDNEIVVKIR